MKYLGYIFFFILAFDLYAQKDTLRSDMAEQYLIEKGKELFIQHPLPTSLSEWKTQKVALQNTIKKKAGVYNNSNIPLDLKIHDTKQYEGYKVLNISFRVRKNNFATGNLLVPDGTGKFPAVLNLHGHYAVGRFDQEVLYRSHKLAKNGFVCLNIDTFGSGERTTHHGEFEYHGGNLGSNLLNIGETLLGAQLMDNIRAIDLLFSLPYVDKKNIGVTGESGGGNQAMWLSAMDSRVKAALPVVSIGTFEAYTLGHNCVCELLPQGATFMEESAVVAMVAPRNIKIFSVSNESNTAFMPKEMLRTFKEASKVFSLYGKGQNISYQIFNDKHGYSYQMADSMLVYFSDKLKNTKTSNFINVSLPFSEAQVASHWVFEKGKRDSNIKTIGQYCSESKIRSTISTNAIEKRSQLFELLALKELKAKNTLDFTTNNVWQRIIVDDYHQIPVKILRANSPKKIVLNIFNNSLNNGKEAENAVNVWLQVFGKETQTSPLLKKYDSDVTELHTMSRSLLWTDHGLLSFWTSEIQLIVKALHSEFPNLPLEIRTEREIGISAIMASVFNPKISKINMESTPFSFRIDEQNLGFDKGYMAAHTPGILQWGDISTLVGLSNADLIFSDTRTFSGRKPYSSELRTIEKHFLIQKGLYKNTKELNIN